MKKLLRRLVFLLLLMVPLAAFGIYGYGKNLPESYEVTRSALYDQPIASVWQAITDYEKIPGWSEHIEKVERREDQEGLPVWRFFGEGDHYMDIEVVKAEEPALFVSRIAETDMPFGGTWTFLLVKKGESTTEVTLKEEGIVASPFWRLVSKFILGESAMVDSYLGELGRKFGETVEIK